MNKILSAKWSYESLRQIILDYYKTQNIDLVYPSIDYLAIELKKSGQSSNYFRFQKIGESILNLSNEQIISYIKAYAEEHGLDVTDVKYGDEIEISYMVKKGLNVPTPATVETETAPNEVSENVSAVIQYTDLRQMVFDYFQKNKNIHLSSISIDYLKDKINNGDMNSSQPFFVINTAFGESRFDFSKEELINIIKSELLDKNCKLTTVDFGNNGINVSYQLILGKKNEAIEDKTEQIPIQRENTSANGQTIHSFQEEKYDNHLQDMSQQTKTNPQEELVRMAKEQRKFTILQRERAMSSAQRAKNRSALLAGACMLGACVATYFNCADINQVIRHEMDAIYSWEALGQYIADLGPITTLMVAGVGGFIAKYFKNAKKFKQAQNELIDMEYAIHCEKHNELGGETNDKSR